MKFIKNNYLLLIVCFLLVSILFTGIIRYQIDNEKIKNSWTTIYESSCLNGNVNDCNLVVTNRDTMSTYNYIISIYIDIIQISSPLLIMIVSAYYLNKYIRKGYLSNALSRKSYNIVIKKIYLKVLKVALILPIYMFILFLITYLLSGHFDYNVGLNIYKFIGFSVEYSKNWLTFIIMYLINMGINSMFWINIVILNVRHNKNVLVSIIVSYIEFFLLLVILEQVGLILFKNTKIIGYFSLMHMWVPNNSVSLIGLIIVSSSLVLLTSIMVYFAYKDKEALLEEISK